MSDSRLEKYEPSIQFAFSEDICTYSIVQKILKDRHFIKARTISPARLNSTVDAIMYLFICGRVFTDRVVQATVPNMDHSA